MKVEDLAPKIVANMGSRVRCLTVALAFAYVVFSSSAMGVPSVLIVPMSEELGWSIGELPAPQGIRLALFGMAAPLAGCLMVRYGPRKMIAVSGALLLVGLALSIVTTHRGGSSGWEWGFFSALRLASLGCRSRVPLVRGAARFRDRPALGARLLPAHAIHSTCRVSYAERWDCVWLC